MTTSHLAAAALAALALFASVGDARAQAPDADALARLGDRLAAARAIRVRTAHGAWIERTVVLSPEGVGLPGSVQFGEAPLEPPQRSLVPWANVTTLETRRGLTGRGMLLGAAVGLVLGAVMAAHTEDSPRTGNSEGPLAIGLGVAGGLMIGASLGSASDPWVRAWPPR